MSDISAFQHKFRATGNNLKHDTTGKVRKRNRAVLSCLQCRSRKSKCDREQPCGSCRGHGTACSYSKQSVKTPTKASPQDRLNHLESMLLEMMQAKEAQAQTQLPLGRSPSQITTPENSISSFESTAYLSERSEVPQGAYTKTENEESYVGPTHWQAILETVHDLKSELNLRESPTSSEGANGHGRPSQTQNLFSTARPPDFASILRALPERSETDRILSAYFNSKYFSVPLIHPSQFQKMYERLWQNPQDMPILWMSQLFSMLSISTALKGNMEGHDPKSKAIIFDRLDKFTNASAQCLVFADYTKPQRHLIEALFLYCQAKGLVHLDPASEVWLLYAIMTRQALRLGYHRDPKHFPHLSVFEGEMRRRAWFLIYTFDILTAFQLGLPCNLQIDDEWDTEFPRSLRDSDFDESSTELPPSRPETDPTPMLYFLAKSSIMNVQKKLLHQQFTTDSVSYENDVLKLDAELEDARERIPSVLKMKSISQSFTDPAYLIMYRFQCDILGLKAMCILHRNFIGTAHRRKHSVDRCTQSAIQILRHHGTIYKETKPGCQLHADQWYIKSLHLTNCFLAAVIVSQIFISTNEDECSSSTKDEILSLLRMTFDITTELREESQEASRFNVALDRILTKIDPIRRSITYDYQARNGLQREIQTSAETTAVTLDMPSTHELESLFNDPENINWNMVDLGLGHQMQPFSDVDWPEIDANYLNSDGNSFILQQPTYSV